MKKAFSTIMTAAILAASTASFAADKPIEPERDQFPVERRNLAQEEANRKLVVDFYNEVFTQHNLDVINKLVAEDYIQHSPKISNGRDTFINALKDRIAQNPQRQNKIIRSVAAGDMVWLHVHSKEKPEDLGRAIVDLFRVKDGKIIEHWDVIQPIPETSNNENTMF